MRLGQKMTDEQRRNVSKGHIGQPGFWTGKKRSAETRLSISLAQRGKKLTLDHRKRIGDANRGRELTEENKRKLRNEISWKVDGDGCWICTSHVPDKKNRSGYPGIVIDYKRIKLSRYMFVKHKGEIPDGLIVRHTCDNRLCINPEHLIVGTPADNVNDEVVRGRSCKGEKHGLHKLSEGEVLEIFRSSRKSGSAIELAKKYCVSKGNIFHIWRGNSWSWLTGGLDGSN